MNDQKIKAYTYKMNLNYLHYNLFKSALPDTPIMVPAVKTFIREFIVNFNGFCKCVASAG